MGLYIYIQVIVANRFGPITECLITDFNQLHHSALLMTQMLQDTLSAIKENRN